MQRTALMAVILLAALLLARCGSGSESPATSAPTPAARSGSPTPAAAALPPASATAVLPAQTAPVAPQPTQATESSPAASLPAASLPAASQPAPTAPAPAQTTAPDLAADLAPTPACTPGSAALTPQDMEGPYYLAGSPERASLVEPGMSGVRLVISGYVLHADCAPAAGARLDFWQADDNGEYDLAGYRLRGHIFADERGYYRIETILPAVYGGRPRHIHVKVQTEALSLTSQLYFPGDSPSPAQSVSLTENGPAATAFFNFILP